MKIKFIFCGLNRFVLLFTKKYCLSNKSKTVEIIKETKTKKLYFIYIMKKGFKVKIRIYK